MRNKNQYYFQKSNAIKRKLYYINKAGGKCQHCGYNKNISALCFHHVNPAEKEFELDSRMLSNSNIEKIENEFKKCILLCHNCHNEHHNPNMLISNFGYISKIELETKKHPSNIKLNLLSDKEIYDIIDNINQRKTTLIKESKILNVSRDFLKKFLNSKSNINCFDKTKVSINSKRKSFKVNRPTKIDWPSNEELIERLSKTSYSALSRELGVSDNAIRKRLKKS